METVKEQNKYFWNLVFSIRKDNDSGKIKMDYALYEINKLSEGIYQSSVSKEMEKVSKGKSSKVFSKDERSYSSFWMYPEIPPSFSSNDSYPTVPHKAAQISHAMEKDGPCIVFFPSVFFMKKTVL